MAGTPEEDLLGWLEREEERLGTTAMADAVEDIQYARDLLYDELGYDITEAQFEGLRDAAYVRYEELPSVSVDYGRVEQNWGYQTVYRDVVTGRFVSAEDVTNLLSALRGS